MDVYSIDYTLYVQDGEHEPKQMTNFTPVIETAYYPLEGSQDDIPAYLGIQLSASAAFTCRATAPTVWRMVSMSPCGTDVSQVRPSSRFRI